MRKGLAKKRKKSNMKIKINSCMQTWTQHNPIKEIMLVAEEEDEQVVLIGEEEVVVNMVISKVDHSNRITIKREILG